MVVLELRRLTQNSKAQLLGSVHATWLQNEDEEKQGKTTKETNDLWIADDNSYVLALVYQGPDSPG